MKKVGFIGAGNMGYPLLCGAVKAFGTDEVLFRCAHEEKNREIEKKLQMLSAASLPVLTQKCNIVLLSVKPQFFDEVLEEIKDDFREDQILISMAPGVSMEYLHNALGGKGKIVRVMPNTPAMVGQGMTAICYGNGKFSEEETGTIEALFQSVGKTVVLPERLMDASVLASGSSPAFMYIFMEALADGAAKYGIPRNVAYEMIGQTMVGAGTMLLETKEHPGILKDNVCSPGGTTIAGVAALEEYGFRNAVLKACDACYEKAEKMKK